MCKKIFKRINFKRIISSVLLFSLFFSALFIGEKKTEMTVEASVESDLAQKQNQLKELENALAAAKKNKADILARLEEDKEKLNSLLTEKSKLEASIGYSESEIELIVKLVEGYSEHLSELETNLQTTKELKDKKIEQLCLVMKYLYENGNVSSLEMLFTSGSFSQYISKREQAQNILSYQKAIIAEMEAVESDTEIAKTEYEKAKASLEGYKIMIDEKKSSVATEYEMLESVITQLEDQVELTEEEFNAIDSIEKEYASEISQVKVDIKELSEYLSKEFRWPLNYNQKYYISSDFGYRNGPFAGYEHHNGIDIVVPYGTPILASAGGVVTRSEYASVFGNVVVITHDNGLQTLYCHCSKRLVSVGDKVKQGEEIAKVGSTGNSTGNHLHFAVILYGSYVDPAKYIKKNYFK